MSYDIAKWLTSDGMPNWLTLTLTIGLPVAGGWLTKIWSHRTRSRVDGLTIDLSPNTGLIRTKDEPYEEAQKTIRIRFTNRLPSELVIRNANLQSVTPLLQLNPKTKTDPPTGDSELKFLRGRAYTEHSIIIEPSQEVETCIFLRGDAPPELLKQFTTPRWRRLLRWPKYFVLAYTVVLGDRVYRVRTTC